MQGHVLRRVMVDLEDRGRALVSASHDDLEDLQRACLSEGMEVEADQVAPGTYRITRKEPVPR